MTNRRQEPGAEQYPGATFEPFPGGANPQDPAQTLPEKVPQATSSSERLELAANKSSRLADTNGGLNKAQEKNGLLVQVRRAPWLTSPGSAGDWTERRPVLAGWLLLAAVMLLYMPSSRGLFLWDDDTHLTANLITHSGGLRDSWLSTKQPDYWPVTWTVLWLGWKILGTNVFGYHLLDMVLHTAVSILAWRILRRLGIPGGWGSALLFAVHPVCVESVAWITQTKTLLATAFGFGSFLLFLHFEDEQKKCWLWGACLALLVALLSKPVFAAAPLILLLFSWWRGRAFGWRTLGRYVPFLAISVCVSSVCVWFQYQRAIQRTLVRDENLLLRMAGAARLVWLYILNAVAPLNLMFVYPRWHLTETQWGGYVPLAILLACFFVLWRKRASTLGRASLFCLGYYLLALLPVLGFFDIYYMRYSLMADHWQYPALVAVVSFAGALLSVVGRRGTGLSRDMARAIFVVAALGLAGLTWERQKVFQDEEVLWRDSLRRNPDAWLAHLNLGLYLRENGKTAEAADNFEQELAALQRMTKRYPTDVVTLQDYGRVLQSAGREAEAELQYRAVVQIRGKTAQAHNLLGAALAAQGKYDEANKQYREAIRLDSDDWEAYGNLGMSLKRQGNVNAALEALRRAASLKPESVQVRMELAELLDGLGHKDEAAALYREVLVLQPGTPGLSRKLLELPGAR